MEELFQQLLADVKNYLDITWSDSDTDKKIENLVRNGMAYLDKKRGEPALYTEPGLARSLLFDYVRYARDQALDVFENNYLPLILSMQNESAVSAYDLEETQPPLP